MTSRASLQIKVCGLTSVDAAIQCAQLGVHAVGCVFYHKSPRHVSDDLAKSICRAVGHRVQTVGVFVDEPFELILKKVTDCGLSAVQLHGSETPALVRRLRNCGISVIKAIFANRPPRLEAAGDYDATAYLVECGTGPLPGGNAASWDWGLVKAFSARFPCILAGGLTPDNIADAFRKAMVPAVDVSSGVESAPGKKDLMKIKKLIDRAAGLVFPSGGHPFYPIFRDGLRKHQVTISVPPIAEKR